MSLFDCTICGNSHKLITLLEFPQPEVISKITSGELNQSLDVISRNSFGINKEYLVLQAQLSLPIIDFEDDFDLYVWVKIIGEEYLSKIRYIQESRYTKIKMEGLVLQSIPFFLDANDLLVEIEVDVNQEDMLFSIVNINKEIQLKNFLKDGISKKDLAVILSPLYH